jgi:hypothetical protein
MPALRSIPPLVLTFTLLLTLLGGAPATQAAPPDGTLVIGVHVTLVSRWLDPGETEALITPFMVLYTLHDALLKPMPGNSSARPVSSPAAAGERQMFAVHTTST